MVSCPCDEREGPNVGKAQLRSLDEHLKSSPSQIDGDGGELGVGQWPHLVVAGNEVPDTVEVYMVCVLNGTSAAPQPEGDVGGEWLVIGELEVEVPRGARQGRNDFGTIGYRGPCPPPGHGVHHYHYRLYALSGQVPLPDRSTITELYQAITDTTLASAELVGTYER